MAVTTLVFGAAVLASCGSSSSPTTTSTTAAPTTTTLPPLSVSRADIQHAYMTLFDLANPAVTPKLAVVQDGSALKAAFTTALTSPLAKLAGGARVDSVKIEHGSACQAETLPSPCASVVYDILSPSHTVLLRHSGGLALYVKGKWLVAKVTICTLLELDNGGKVPPGC
jgi:hypothetical protein